MFNISFLLLGVTLTLVSIAAITYSSSDLRNTSVKRHKFFKSIRLFMYLYIIPAFVVIMILNLREIMIEEYVTVSNSYLPALYIISAVINLIITILLIGRPLNKGIDLFRRHNRDNTKYAKALNTSRNGLVLILVMTALTIFLIMR